MKNLIKKLTLIVVALLSFHVVVAQNPHFVSGPTITDNGTTLTASGSIAGLGNNALIIIGLNATVTVTTTCTNRGGNIAPGQTKTETVSTTKKFISDKNGRVNFSITTPIPSPGTCPNGNWKGEVSDVDFSGTTITVGGIQVYP